MTPAIRIRAGSGLGDSLYLQAIVRHLLLYGHAVEACSDWPDLFRPLEAAAGDRLTVSPFRKDGIDRVAHYTARKGIAGTDQFEDCCLRAHIRGPVDLRLDWTVADPALAGRVAALPRPVIAVPLPRAPFGRADGFGAELLPDCSAIQRAIDRLRDQGASIVQIGKGEPLYRFVDVDFDLADRTTVAQLVDVASLVDGFLGYVSFLVPLAESLGKPGLFVWSRRGLSARASFVRRVTPDKVLHRPSSLAVFDDAGDDAICRAADALRLSV